MVQLQAQQSVVYAGCVALLVAEASICSHGLRDGLQALACCSLMIGLQACAGLLTPLKKDVLFCFEAVAVLFCTFLTGGLLLVGESYQSPMQPVCTFLELAFGPAFVVWATVMHTHQLVLVKAVHSCSIVLPNLTGACTNPQMLLLRALGYCSVQLFLASMLKQRAQDLLLARSKQQAASPQQAAHSSPAAKQDTRLSRSSPSPRPSVTQRLPTIKTSSSVDSAKPSYFDSRPPSVRPSHDQSNVVMWNALSDPAAYKHSNFPDVDKTWISSPCCVSNETCMAAPFCSGCAPKQDELQLQLQTSKERGTSGPLGAQSSSSGGGTNAIGVSLETWCSSVTLDTSLNLSQISGVNPWSQSQPVPMSGFSQSPFSSNTVAHMSLDSTPSIQTVDTAMGDGHTHGHHNHRWGGASDLQSTASAAYDVTLSNQGTPGAMNKPASRIAAFVSQSRQSLMAMQHMGGASVSHLRQLWLKRNHSSAFISEQDVTHPTGGLPGASTSEQLPEPLPVAEPVRPFSTPTACVTTQHSIAPDGLQFLDSQEAPSLAKFSHSNALPGGQQPMGGVHKGGSVAWADQIQSNQMTVLSASTESEASSSLSATMRSIGPGTGAGQVNWQQLLEEFRSALATCAQQPGQAGSYMQIGAGVDLVMDEGVDGLPGPTGAADDCYAYQSPLGDHQQVSIKIRTAHNVKELAPDSMHRLQRLMDRHHKAARLGPVSPLITSMSVRQGCVQIVLETVQPGGPHPEPVQGVQGDAGDGEQVALGGADQPEHNEWIGSGSGESSEDDRDGHAPLWKLAGDVQIQSADNKLCASRCPETEQLEQLAVEVVEALGLDKSKLQDKDRVDVQVKGMMCTAVWDAAACKWRAMTRCMSACCDPLCGDVLATRFVGQPQALSAPASRGSSPGLSTSQSGALMHSETDRPSLVRHRDAQCTGGSGAHGDVSTAGVVSASCNSTTGSIVLRCSISLPMNCGVEGYQPVVGGGHAPVTSETGGPGGSGAPNIHVLIQVNGQYLRSEITHFTITPSLSQEAQGMQVAHVLVKTALGTALSTLPNGGPLANGSQVICGKVELWHGAWVLDAATVLIPPEAVRVSLPRYGQPTSQSSPLPLPMPLHPHIDFSLCSPNYLSNIVSSTLTSEGLEDTCQRPFRRRAGQQNLISWLSGAHASDSCSKNRNELQTDVRIKHSWKPELHMTSGLKMPLVAGLSMPATPQNRSQQQCSAAMFSDARSGDRDAGGWGDQDMTGRSSFMSDLATWMSMLQDSQQQLCLEASKCSMTSIQMSPTLIAYASVLGKALLRYAVRHGLRDIAGCLFASMCSPAGHRLMCLGDAAPGASTTSKALSKVLSNPLSNPQAPVQIEKVFSPGDATELARLASRSGDSEMVVDVVKWFSPLIDVPPGPGQQDRQQSIQKWPSIPEDMSCENPERSTSDLSTLPSQPCATTSHRHVAHASCADGTVVLSQPGCDASQPGPPSSLGAPGRSDSEAFSSSSKWVCGSAADCGVPAYTTRPLPWSKFLGTTLRYLPDAELEEEFCLYRANRALPMQLWWSVSCVIAASGLTALGVWDHAHDLRWRSALAIFTLCVLPATAASCTCLLALLGPNKRRWLLRLELVATVLACCQQVFVVGLGIPGAWTSARGVKLLTQMKRVHMDILILPVIYTFTEQTRARLSLVCQLFSTVGLTFLMMACGLGFWEALSRGLAVSVVALVYSLVLDAHMRGAFLQSLHAAAAGGVVAGAEALVQPAGYAAKHKVE